MPAERAGERCLVYLIYQLNSVMSVKFTLTVGDISIYVSKEWKITMEDYFTTKKIEIYKTTLSPRRDKLEKHDPVISLFLS